MADRNLNFDPTVTAVTPEKPDTGLLTGVTDLAETIATQSASSKALAATTQTAFAFRQADAQYRQDAAGNPNDPEALAKLQSSRAEITAQVGQQVPAISSRDYMTHVMELQQNSDKLNELWGMHQTAKNADADLQYSENTQLKMAAMAGRQFGQDGANMGNLSSVLNFEQAQQAIKQFVTPVIGAPRTDDYLRNFSSNWVKSFVSGLAEQNPEAAKLMLQQDNITTHFTPQEIGDMTDVIKKTVKQQKYLTDVQTTQNTGQLLDLVNDPNSGYFEKRVTIEKMIDAGTIPAKAGNSAIRILHAQDAVDAQTDAPVMANIIGKVNDLNAKAQDNSSDYLVGVKDIHNQILQEMGNGNLTQDDATKLTKHVDQLMKTKLEQATNAAGMTLSDANQKFDALPPEYRADATRQLFYATNDKKLDPIKDKDQINNQATAIIQQINTQRRLNAQKVINGVAQSDDMLLKQFNYTQKDVETTAAKYGISPQDVLLQLRAKAGAAARAKASHVDMIKGGRGSSDDKEDEPAAAAPAAKAADDTDAMDAEYMQ